MSPWLSGMPSRSLRPTQGHGVAVFQAQSLQRGADLGVGLVDADHDRALGHAPGRHASATRQGPCAPRCSVRWRRPRWCRSAPDGGAADVDAGEVRSRCQARPQARRRRRDGPEAAALVGPNQQRRPVEHLPARFGVCRHAMAGRRRTALGPGPAPPRLRRRARTRRPTSLRARTRRWAASPLRVASPAVGCGELRVARPVMASTTSIARAPTPPRPGPTRRQRGSDRAEARRSQCRVARAEDQARPAKRKRQRGRPCRIRGAQAEGRQKRRRRPT